MAASDLDRDNKVTLDEVLFVVDRLGAMSDAVAGTATAMFDTLDENADGKISADEYRQLIEAWNGCETDTDEIFPLLDLDGDGQLSRQDSLTSGRNSGRGTTRTRRVPGVRPIRTTNTAQSLNLRSGNPLRSRSTTAVLAGVTPSGPVLTLSN
ncbi:MAG TPA: EF-hand domain-containing protein [Pseudonocardiaceae bacterium]|nr:EF-hand domain-containing protein [Pseudonocardiaceae bacterium]